jgi:hypothetical protein
VRKQMIARTVVNINRRKLNGIMPASSILTVEEDESEIVFVPWSEVAETKI